MGKPLVPPQKELLLAALEFSLVSVLEFCFFFIFFSSLSLFLRKSKSRQARSLARSLDRSLSRSDVSLRDALALSGKAQQ